MTMSTLGFTGRGQVRANVKASSSRVGCGFGSGHRRVVRHTMTTMGCTHHFISSIRFCTRSTNHASGRCLTHIMRTIVGTNTAIIGVPSAANCYLPSRCNTGVGCLVSRMSNVSGTVVSARYRGSLNVTATGAVTNILGNTHRIRIAVGNVNRHTNGATLRRVTVVVGDRRRVSVRAGVGARGVCPADHVMSDLVGVPMRPGGTVIKQGTFTRSSNVRRSNILGGMRACRVVSPRSINVSSGSVMLATHDKHTTLGGHLGVLNIGLRRSGLSGICRRFLGLTSGGGSVGSSSVLMLTNTSHDIGRHVGLSCLRIADNINMHSMTDLKLGVSNRGFRTYTDNGNPISTTVGTLGGVISHRVALGRFAVRTVDGKDSSMNGIRVRIRCSGRVCCNFKTGASVVTTSMRTCVSYVGGFGSWSES